MNVFFLAYGILFSLATILTTLLCIYRKYFHAEVLATVVFYTCGLLCFVIYFTFPSAMDVYRGKTELRITYEGKTPVDSTVIYKKGDKNEE